MEKYKNIMYNRFLVLSCQDPFPRLADFKGTLHCKYMVSHLHRTSGAVYVIFQANQIIINNKSSYHIWHFEFTFFLNDQNFKAEIRRRNNSKIRKGSKNV